MSEQVDTIEVESKENVLKFAQRYTNLLLEQKRIKEDVKVLCQEFTELGIPTKVVIKAINEQKKIKKSGSRELEEVQLYMAWMADSKELDDALTELVAK